ncbi:MAG TPA: 23S rRNA (pseudouridine(1915)-N(3))-methyltransferase RlmH [Clostridiales bacterium]|nr:23S rRNA (pseudouridine(1915)-N(3))-methyltransferase RlmH [Clostridiales bacterium]
MKINVVAVGNIKQKYFVEAIKEYEKRISRYAKLNIIEVKEFGDNEKTLLQEEQGILKNLKGKVILLDLEGDDISSTELADLFENSLVSGDSEITFVIGGSRGVSKNVKDAIPNKIRFGKVTYPHQLMRVILLEQIYRALSINAGSDYHK